MKSIFAIFAIACLAAFFALRESGLPSNEATPSPAAIAAESILPLSDASTVGAPAASELAVSGNTVGHSGAELLRAAIENLERWDSVEALVRYRIGLFQSELIGSGLYQQTGQGSQRRFRLELKTQLGDKVASHLQVCDGRTLWSYEEKTNGPQLSRLDLARVRVAQRQAGHVPPTSPLAELPAGGLPKLLNGLRATFEPISAQDGYLGDTAVWAIEAEWKPALLAAVVPEQKDRIIAGQGCDVTKAPQLAERVTLFLGHEDLFPQRIEFRRRTSGEAGQGRRGEFLPVVTIEFSDTRFNQPIDPRQFDYQQGAAGEDVTEKFLKSRGLSPR